MKITKSKIKLTYITGLKNIVLDEVNRNLDTHIVKTDEDTVYLDHVSDLNKIKKLHSVTRAYIVLQDRQYNPRYISKHKSILGHLIETVISGIEHRFKTFKITCAGSDSPEVRAVAEYIQNTYRIREEETADLKVHIIKLNDEWEVGVQITPRPLSVRNYKVRNMSGAMDPTIAHAVNSLCKPKKDGSYLNVFSGSATLLIEAGLSYPKLELIIGFDNDKKHLSLSIQNIKKAGLIKKIQIKEADVFDQPDFGMFDIITSDLPFGMSMSKAEDLKSLYQNFVEFCEKSLNPDGCLAIYTSEHKIFENIISKSKFNTIKTLELKFMTSVDAYLKPKIFVCKLQ